MCFGWMPNRRIYGNAGLHKIYLKTKISIQKKQVPFKSLLCNALIQPHFNYACAAWYPNLNKKYKKKLAGFTKQVYTFLLTIGKHSYQKIVQKLYKMYTKIIQNTKFVYILYTKTVQIKILYDNEYTKSVHQIPTHIQKIYKLYKSCTQFRLKTA